MRRELKPGESIADGNSVSVYGPDGKIEHVKSVSRSSGGESVFVHLSKPIIGKDIKIGEEVFKSSPVPVLVFGGEQVQVDDNLVTAKGVKPDV